MSPMSAESTVVRNYLDWMLVDSLEKADARQDGLGPRRRTFGSRSLWAGKGQGTHH